MTTQEQLPFEETAKPVVTKAERMEALRAKQEAKAAKVAAVEQVKRDKEAAKAFAIRIKDAEVEAASAGYNKGFTAGYKAACAAALVALKAV